jgi:hypothetical protein
MALKECFTLALLHQLAKFPPKVKAHHTTSGAGGSGIQWVTPDSGDLAWNHSTIPALTRFPSNVSTSPDR